MHSLYLIGLAAMFALFLQLRLEDHALHQYWLANHNPPRAELKGAISEAAVYSNKGVFACRAERNEEALHDFDRAIELQNNLSEAHFNRGNLYYRTKRYRNAIDDYAECCRLNPLDDEALLWLENARRMAGDRLGGIESLARWDWLRLLKILHLVEST